MRRVFEEQLRAARESEKKNYKLATRIERALGGLFDRILVSNLI